MSIRVIHVVESQVPSAGSIAVCLPGLLKSLQTAGPEGIIVDHLDDWNSQSASSQIVHIHGWDYPLALHAARDARQAGKPYILSPLGHLTPSPLNRKGILQRLRSLFAQRPLVRGSAAVTALNEIDQRTLRAASVHPNIALLPYGICFQDFEESPAKTIGPVPHQKLLMLGPLDPLLGCVVTLKAFAELGAIADGWTVTLAGDDRGNWRSKLEAAVRRKGGETRILFQDAKTLDDQKQLLREADLLVAASLHVSPAVSIMQALAAGVPVVATQNAAPPGLSAAVRVCGPSRAELRETLRNMMQMTLSLRQELAHAAREKARSLFDWSVLAPRFAELYTTCTRN